MTGSELSDIARQLAKEYGIQLRPNQTTPTLLSGWKDDYTLINHRDGSYESVQFICQPAATNSQGSDRDGCYESIQVICPPACTSLQGSEQLILSVYMAQHELTAQYELTYRNGIVALENSRERLIAFRDRLPADTTSHSLNYRFASTVLHELAKIHNPEEATEIRIPIPFGRDELPLFAGLVKAYFPPSSGQP